MSRAQAMPVEFIQGDRFCLTCGANLIGAPIVREAHYDMLIARCGSCDQVAHIQETRKLSRAAQRWTGIALAGWMLRMAVLWLGGSAAMFGLTQGLIFDARRPLGAHIQKLYEQYQPEDIGGIYETDVNVIQATPAAPLKVVINYEDEELIDRFGIWWAQQDPQALLADAGGLSGMLDWAQLWPWLLIGMSPFVFGAAWSLLMLNIRRKYLIMALPLTVLGYIAICLVMVFVWSAIPPRSPFAASMTVIGPTLTYMGMTYFIAFLYAGMLSGRTIARGAMCLTLSPKAISRMALLWRTDSYHPPRLRSTSVV